MEENRKPIFMYKDVPVRKTNDRCLLFVGRKIKVSDEYDFDNLSDEEIIFHCETLIKKINDKSKSLTRHYGPFEPNPDPKANEVEIEKITTDMANYIFEHYYNPDSGGLEETEGFSSEDEWINWWSYGANEAMYEELTTSGFEYNDEWEDLIESGEIEEYDHQHDEIIIEKVDEKLFSLVSGY